MEHEFYLVETDSLNLLDQREEAVDEQCSTIVSQANMSNKVPEVSLFSYVINDVQQEIEQPGIRALKPSNWNIESDNQELDTHVDSLDNTFFTPNDLRELLKRTDTGKAILSNAEHGTLSKDSKKELSGIIAENHIKRSGGRGRFSKDYLKNYSKCIELLLPHEKQDMITYYIPAAPPERRNPGGSIHQAYKRLKGTISKRQDRELDHQRKLGGKENSSTSDIIERNSKVDQARRWLQLNVHPWDIVLKMWKETFHLRITCLRSLKCGDILIKYPHYKEELGYQLIDEDYRDLGYKEKRANWKNIIDKLRTYFILKVRSQNSLVVLEFMNRSNQSEDALFCCFLILLNCCVKPSKITKTMRPAILTAQEDVLMFAGSLDSARESIKTLFEAYAVQNITPHPKIVAIGVDYTSTKREFYVLYEDIVYKLDSAARAVDVLIKMSNIFKLPFSKITKLVWYTIEEVMYDTRAPAQYKQIEEIKAICL
ncbi:uncharacterized protein LOC129718104 [Wyeomyia smithii]|uniref:uncharacterized protein LOC129718104 n=1 Tax=Wyeomyia smithii TaxID=174621 RepID=UPI00246811B9|nr:uncharacterized protein LOC129718104 [Wyeomyia smithii]